MEGPRNTDTRVQQALEALKESRERLQAALDASKTGTWRWNIPAQTLDCDENLNRLLGLPAGHAVTRLDEFIAIVHPYYCDNFRASRQLALQKHTATTLEYRIIWPDRSEHWLDNRGSTAFGEDGSPLYMTGACVDITGRKTSERVVREAEARKDEFLAMLA